MPQLKQNEWRVHWEIFKDDEIFLFNEWIRPCTLEDFRAKDVLECGCGQHTTFIAPYAKSITAVDLNTTDIAQERNRKFNNIEFIEADITDMDLEKKFDVVISIGVIHHTDNPDMAIANLKKHLKSGGKLILWVYSLEGNLLVRNVLEPIRKLFLKNINRRKLFTLSRVITFFMYIPIYSIYKLPLRFLPYYEYFENFRKLTFYRNHLNIFDKLNAPRVTFINKKRVLEWLNPMEFKDIHISNYKNLGWRGSGTKKCLM